MTRSPDDGEVQVKPLPEPMERRTGKRLALPRWPHSALLLLRLPLLVGLSLTSSFAATAQQHKSKHKQVKPAVVIVAEGKVLQNGAAVAGAVVYLENPKSLSIKSYLTQTDGSYHFSNLAPQTDYEVWAEQNGVQSKHKFISQFSSHTKFVFTLKLEPGGHHKLLGIF